MVLIGDAAHATGPSMAQGASLAAEDVHVLARGLAGPTTDVDVALTQYAARRAPRTRYVHETTALRNQVAAQSAVAQPTLIQDWPTLSVQSFAALVPAP